MLVFQSCLFSGNASPKRNVLKLCPSLSLCVMKMLCWNYKWMQVCFLQCQSVLNIHSFTSYIGLISCSLLGSWPLVQVNFFIQCLLVIVIFKSCVPCIVRYINMKVA